MSDTFLQLHFRIDHLPLIPSMEPQSFLGPGRSPLNTVVVLVVVTKVFCQFSSYHCLLDKCSYRILVTGGLVFLHCQHSTLGTHLA